MIGRDPVVTERWALAVLRVSLGLFLLLWGIEKFVIPEVTGAIWSNFYGVGPASSLYLLRDRDSWTLDERLRRRTGP